MPFIGVLSDLDPLCTISPWLDLNIVQHLGSNPDADRLELAGLLYAFNHARTDLFFRQLLGIIKGLEYLHVSTTKCFTAYYTDNCPIVIGYRAWQPEGREYITIAFSCPTDHFLGQYPHRRERGCLLDGLWACLYHE